MLIVLALAERTVRIHTGFGLEGTAGFRGAAPSNGKSRPSTFAAAIMPAELRDLVIAVVQKTAAEYGQTIAGVPRPRDIPVDQPNVADAGDLFSAADDRDRAGDRLFLYCKAGEGAGAAAGRAPRGRVAGPAAV